MWKTIETAPKDETNSYIVFVPKRKGVDEYDSIIQVSNFQGDMYPDNRQCCVNWDDRIEGATHWMPLPPPPQQQEQFSHTTSADLFAELGSKDPDKDAREVDAIMRRNDMKIVPEQKGNE